MIVAHLGIIVVAFLMSTSILAQDYFDSATAQDAISTFQLVLEADLPSEEYGAITAGIVHQGKIDWTESYGWADGENKIAASRETTYRIGSITKSITAALLLDLNEDGLLELDDSIEQYLPEIRELINYGQHDPITFRQLASHTAGLVREPSDSKTAAAGPLSNWEQKALDAIEMTEIDRLPGERYHYSNIGFGLLGLAASRVADIPFMELVESRLFEPLAMTSSFFILNPSREINLATGYFNIRGVVPTELPENEHGGRGYKVPNGGVYSTVDDLAKFIGEFTNDTGAQILSSSSKTEMLRIHTPENNREGYGLGFTIVTTPNDTKFVSHSGSVAGYSAYLVFDPAAQIGVVFLRNYNIGNSDMTQEAVGLLSALIGE